MSTETVLRHDNQPSGRAAVRGSPAVRAECGVLAESRTDYT